MSDNFWEEVFSLVDEYDSKRPRSIRENRLYYNTDGTIIGLWETGHPDGTNYIILDDTGIFFHNNTNLLRVKDQKLILLDAHAPNKTRLVKSNTGVKTVKGHAGLSIEAHESYTDIEYYDRTNH
jgi:hypothetical protein